jgi:dihydropteroate synthase
VWPWPIGIRTHVVGVLNVTPDSFSDGGEVLTPEAAVAAGRRMQQAGASLIDVGGESTRPGAAPVTAEEERARVIPVIAALARAGVGPISVDTYKSVTAAAAMEAGAQVINDISGGRFDPAILRVAAEAGCPVVLTHARARPETMQQGTWTYEPDVVTAVERALTDIRDRATQTGIQADRIALDPGIGFGKTLDENLCLLRALPRLRKLGCPLMVGTSRKGFIGKLTGRPPKERGYGTAATVALAVAGGADFVRVHDVEQMMDVVRVADAWIREDRPS